MHPSPHLAAVLTRVKFISTLVPLQLQGFCCLPLSLTLPILSPCFCFSQRYHFWLCDIQRVQVSEIHRVHRKCRLRKKWRRRRQKWAKWSSPKCTAFCRLRAHFLSRTFQLPYYTPSYVTMIITMFVWLYTLFYIRWYLPFLCYIALKGVILYGI